MIVKIIDWVRFTYRVLKVKEHFVKSAGSRATMLVKSIAYEKSSPIVPLKATVTMAGEGFIKFATNNVKLYTIICEGNRLLIVIMLPDIE